MKISAYQNKKKRVFELRTSINERLSLQSILFALKGAMHKNKIKNLQWPINDEFFKYFSANLMTNEVLRIFKDGKIILIKPVTVITDVHQQEKLLDDNHNDRTRGGHCGQKRLYAKLRELLEKYDKRYRKICKKM